MDADFIDSEVGSPPRVRGKLHERRQVAQRRGITPARAGKTMMRFFPSTNSRDHPRACGENKIVDDSEIQQKGSPPRVRGKRPEWLDDFVRQRITPARAGKTEIEYCSVMAWKDHPRACGENGKTGRKSVWTKGSPPRVRGKLAALHFFDVVTGITPARAGKTRPVNAHRVRSWDHPRACGENL